MIPERDDANFAALVDALGPYLDRVVIIGGWAHRLFRNHPLAQPVPYAPLMTRDTDIAVAPGIRPDEQSLRERLLSHGFHEEFLGDDRPPVTHWADRVRPELGRRTEAKVLRARRQLFNAVTDTVREAAIMSAGRTLSPQALVELCQVGLAQLMDEAPSRQKPV